MTRTYISACAVFFAGVYTGLGLTVMFDQIPDIHLAMALGATAFYLTLAVLVRDKET